MARFRIRVGKDNFNDPYYVTTIKRRRGQVVEYSISCPDLSKSFYSPKRRETAERMLKAILSLKTGASYIIEEFPDD